MKKIFIILLAAGFTQSNLLQARLIESAPKIITPQYTDLNDVRKGDIMEYPPQYEDLFTEYGQIVDSYGAESTEAQNHAAVLNWIVNNHRSMMSAQGPVTPPVLVGDTGKSLTDYNEVEKLFQGVGRALKGAINVVNEAAKAGISAAEAEIHKELDRAEHNIDPQLKDDIKNMVTHLGNAATVSIDNTAQAAGEIAENGVYEIVDHASGRTSKETLLSNIQSHAQDQLNELGDKSIDLAGETATKVAQTTGSILTNPVIQSAADNDGSDAATFAAGAASSAGTALMQNADQLGDTITTVGHQVSDLGKAFQS